MPLGAARLTLLAFQPTVAVEAEVIRKKIGITAHGDTQVDTAQYKFGGASAYTNPATTTSARSLRAYINSDWAWGTGDFTYECWFRPTAIANSTYLFDQRTAFGTGSGTLLYRSYSTNDWIWVRGGTTLLSYAHSPSNGTWYHIAVCRSSGTTKMFIDGTEVASATDTYSYVQGNTRLFIGAYFLDNQGFDGHIDEFRVSNTARYTSGFTPSTTPFVNDDDTLLLMHMDGTDASTYFEDDNGVGRAAVGVSAVATAQVDTAQSYFGGSSAIFNPSSLDHLLIDDISGSNNLDTNWTFECWYRPTNRTGTVYPVILANHTTSWGSGDWGFFDRHNDASTKFAFFINAYSSGSPALESTTVVSNGTWYHLAVVKEGNDYELFVDGTSEDTLTTAAAIATNRDLRIGSSGNATTKTVNGHIDEVRISDTARYTANFTRPTAPFVNDADTKLLLHCDGTDGSTLFLDDNGTQGRGNQVVVTAEGDAQIDTAQSKFGGASALFDNAGDRLVGQNIDFAQAFTVECFARSNGAWDTGTQAIFSTELLPLFVSSGKIAMYNTNVRVGSTTMSGDTWYHLVWESDGTDLYMYIDGSHEGTYTLTAGQQAESNQQFKIASNWAETASLDGHIDEMRVTQGRRYNVDTGSFTAPTEPFENDTNTLLLLHMDGAYDGSTVFIDSSGDRTPIGFAANGNAQTDTAQSKIGGSSLLLDGTGDYLSTGSSILQYNPKLGLNYDYWTVEYWLRINSHAGTFQHTLGFWNATAPTGVVYYFSSNMYNGTNKMGLQYKYADNSDSGALTFGSALSTGVWQHHAFVRNGNTLTAYLDGVSQGTHTMTGRTIDITGYNSTTISTMPFTIGAMTDASGPTNGWMDEIRISDTARYTTAFTPSTTPFQNDANTVLLLHCDGSDGDTDYVDDNGKEST